MGAGQSDGGYSSVEVPSTKVILAFYLVDKNSSVYFEMVCNMCVARADSSPLPLAIWKWRSKVITNPILHWFTSIVYGSRERHCFFLLSYHSTIWLARSVPLGLFCFYFYPEPSKVSKVEQEIVQVHTIPKAKASPDFPLDTSHANLTPSHSPRTYDISPPYSFSFL